MSNFIINGGKKLTGEITTNTAKNPALSCMYACLLTDEESTLTDVPRIEEVARTIEVLESIGVQTEWIEEHTLKITPAKKLTLKNINKEAAAQTRVALFLIGTLAQRYKHFQIPQSGGCKLGSRTVFPHFHALKNFGVTIDTKSDHYEIRQTGEFAGKEVIMYEQGDSATENVIFAAVLAKGTTIIKFASSNYMVQDLCYLLESMGAKIQGIGTSTLTITGVLHLKGANNYPLMPDPIESMLLISLAATTGSSITIKGCPKDFIALELAKLEVMNFKYSIQKEYKSKNEKFDLWDIQTFESELQAIKSPDKIEAHPYPGINMDNLPFFVPIATQASGQTLIHDWPYENRAIYYMEFQKLGAEIVLADPHRVYITGKTPLKGAEIICPPALRPATIFLVGMLAAQGQSILRNTYPIDRGYENLYNRLKLLGADIETF
mgnify:CR=1 FL=1